MSARFTLATAPGGGFTTTCKACGEQYEAPYKSWIDAWRDSHQCPSSERSP